jgi:hypothetical protein
VIQRESCPFVADVTNGGNRYECRPQKERIRRYDGARIEEDTGDSNQRGKNHDRRSQSDEDQDIVISHIHDICLCPGFFLKKKRVKFYQGVSRNRLYF